MRIQRSDVNYIDNKKKCRRENNTTNVNIKGSIGPELRFYPHPRYPRSLAGLKDFTSPKKSRLPSWPTFALLDAGCRNGRDQV